MDDIIYNRIFDSWSRGRNVLLYGPPGTGKTRIISQLFHKLQQPDDNPDAATIGPDSTMALPLTRPTRKLPIPTPAKVVWTTFHQSYTYEDFVIGLKPSTAESSLSLEPWAGILLDAVIELNDDNSKYKSVVLFIDEINRGNAARIFGEFMTFLDFDYREDGAFPIPIPLRQINYRDGESEEIHRPDGGIARIKKGLKFPKDIYIVATMNSVDRAAVPIDSALARRFDRLYLKPSEETLKYYWFTEFPLGNEDVDHYSAQECAIAIFNYLNDAIAADLGSEFELGHGLFMSLQPSESGSDLSWKQLAELWDETIFPQLEDRFAGRADVLCGLLKADNPPEDGDYAWTVREDAAHMDGSGVLAPVDVSSVDKDTIARSLRWLAR